METTVMVVGVNCYQTAVDDTNAADYLGEKYLHFIGLFMIPPQLCGNFDTSPKPTWQNEILLIQYSYSSNGTFV